MTNPDHEAFPSAEQQDDEGSLPVGGLTKREYFAAKFGAALASDVEIGRWLQTDPRYRKQPDGHFNFSEVLATNACEMADALIAALNYPKPPT